MINNDNDPPRLDSFKGLWTSQQTLGSLMGSKLKCSIDNNLQYVGR